jgi:pimeloyl-ACP methyl ester carboxylesterase
MTAVPNIDQPTRPGYLREFGGTGSPVVLVGDILGGYASWSPHAERLTPNWRVIGVSPLVVLEAAEGRIAPAEWGVPLESAALEAALNAAGVGRIHLAGWSLGGTIALDFALRRPDLIKSLTLIEPPVWWLLRQTGQDSPSLQPAADWFRSFGDKDITEEGLAGFMVKVGGTEPDVDPRQTRAWRLAWTHRLAIASSWRVIGHEDDPARLSSLRMPALLVRGTESLARDRLIASTLKEHIPHAALLELLGRHTSHFEAMDAFLEAFERVMAEAESWHGRH